MKKTVFSFIVFILSSSVTFACRGGDLLNILFTEPGNGGKKIAATYNISTKNMVSKSVWLYEIYVYDYNRGVSLCSNESCTQLVDMSNTDLLVTYNMGGHTGSVKIEKVSMGGNAPVAKAMRMSRRPAPDFKDVASHDSPYSEDCSKHN